MQIWSVVYTQLPQPGPAQPRSSTHAWDWPSPLQWKVAGAPFNVSLPQAAPVVSTHTPGQVSLGAHAIRGSATQTWVLVQAAVDEQLTRAPLRHGPPYATATAAIAAKHAFTYVVPSQPHTRSWSSGHAPGRGAHWPAGLPHDVGSQKTSDA